MCPRVRETKREESNKIFLPPKQQQKQEMTWKERSPNLLPIERTMEIGDKRESKEPNGHFLSFEERWKHAMKGNERREERGEGKGLGAVSHERPIKF
jgi:hypothetical protein